MRILVLAHLLSGCGEPSGELKPTFYHWETRLAPDPAQRGLLAGHDRLYVKAFDVVWEAGAPRPTAEIEITDTSALPVLVPVVFITNEAIRRTGGNMEALANDINSLTERLLPAGYPELQLDCDWTAGTKEGYFALLELMQASNPARAITCTVRLHQYRDRATQGTPPVDRATLMAYNTGSLDSYETENSITDPLALKHYLADQPPYPIPLDVAVAVYDWAAVYRRGKLVGLLNEPDLEALKETTRFTALTATRYRADTTTYLDGTLLYEGDLLRLEAAPPEAVGEQAAAIRGYVGAFPGQRLMLYRLGSRLWRGQPAPPR